MGIVKDIIVGAVGYSIASSSKSTVVGDIIDNNVTPKSLEDIIENYARRRDIFRDNRFAHRLHEIARKYEEYNYEEEYGDRW